jgi:hypothetical protein
MPSRGQATVELVALLLVAAALTLALAPRLGGPASVVAARLAGAPSPQASAARELALAAAALRGEPAAPTVEDAAVLLGDVLGSDAAGRALDALASRELAPLQVGTDPRAPERPRPGPIVAHVVTAREEASYAPYLRQIRRANGRTRAALSLLSAAAAVAGPEAAIAVGGAAALLAPGDVRALPAGTRTGDVILCIPVATRRGDAVLATVLRDGRPLRRTVERRARCAA